MSSAVCSTRCQSQLSAPSRAASVTRYQCDPAAALADSGGQWSNPLPLSYASNCVVIPSSLAVLSLGDEQHGPLMVEQRRSAPFTLAKLTPPQGRRQGYRHRHIPSTWANRDQLYIEFSNGSIPSGRVAPGTAICKVGSSVDVPQAADDLGLCRTGECFQMARGIVYWGLRPWREPRRNT
jgi:hypothetical protein